MSKLTWCQKNAPATLKHVSPAELLRIMEHCYNTFQNQIETAVDTYNKENALYNVLESIANTLVTINVNVVTEYRKETFILSMEIVKTCEYLVDCNYAKKYTLDRVSNDSRFILKVFFTDDKYVKYCITYNKNSKSFEVSDVSFVRIDEEKVAHLLASLIIELVTGDCEKNPITLLSIYSVLYTYTFRQSDLQSRITVYNNDYFKQIKDFRPKLQNLLDETSFHNHWPDVTKLCITTDPVLPKLDTVVLCVCAFLEAVEDNSWSNRTWSIKESSFV